MHAKLYVARKENRLYQKDVAKKIGIHPQTYHEKESGKVDFTLREAVMLTKVFGCTLNDLFQAEKDEPVNSNERKRKWKLASKWS